MSFEIFSDTTCNLQSDIIDNLDINILPITIAINDNEYEIFSNNTYENTDIFHHKNRKKNQITTSGVKLETFVREFENTLDTGSDILYIAPSSSFSNSFDIAQKVAKELKLDYPERKIHIIDSISASMGLGIIVQEAAKMRLNGKKLDEIRKWIGVQKHRTMHLLTANNLSKIMKIGFYDKVSAALKLPLGIKPVLSLNDSGDISFHGWFPGKRKSLDKMISSFGKTVLNPSEQTIYILHYNSDNDADYLQNKIKQTFNVGEIIVTPLSPIIGVHTGHGTVGLFYLGMTRG